MHKELKLCHNPYFNRWFSAIKAPTLVIKSDGVTILILIDGFLQWFIEVQAFLAIFSSQSLF